MSNDKIKLGLLLDSYTVPTWLFHSLKQIVDSEYAEFIVILNNEEHQSNEQGRNQQGFAYRVLNQLDEKVFLRGANAFAPANLQAILASVPVFPICPTHEGTTIVFKPQDIQRIRDFNLDILIKVGFQQLSGEIITAAKYGLWYYEQGDNRTKRGGPPGFWEVVESLPDTGVTLSIANAKFPNGWTVYRSRFLTHPFSPARNRNTSSWGSSSFLSRQIHLLYRLGEAKFLQETAKFNFAFDLYDCKQYHNPTNLEAIWSYTRLFFRNMFELYQRTLHLDWWYLLFDFAESKSLSFGDFKKLAPPKDRFWADPQVIRRDGKYFIFVEEYPYQNQKGHISVIEMDEQGNCKPSVPVLMTDYHLSYPFVFEYEGNYYMVPESAASGTVDLYESVEFPTRWIHKMTLMKNVTAKDTTLFFNEGKWWLFTGIRENAGAHPEVELFLFYADDLFTTDWKSHPLNPVISDVTSARPAGRLFVMDGKLYRPSQDCSKNYGYGFNLNEIFCLTETEYIEKKVAAVKPNWDPWLVATHTFTRGDGLVIIDAATRRNKFM